jgi:ketosteroid isomerase-like protein
MADTEHHKQVVLAWLAAVNGADEQGILDLLTEDFLFITMARRPEWMKYRWNRLQFAAAPKAQSSVMRSPIKMTMIKLIADGDTVVLEAVSEGILRNGKLYDNAYSLIFELRAGKVQEVREYSCSHLVVETFGEFDPNNPEASNAVKPAA